MEYSGIHNRNISTAGDSATGDPSSSTCYGGICMPACSQMVLDRWLLIFGCFFLFVCTFFVCFFFLLYVSVCLYFLSSFLLCFCDGGICMPACTQMVLDRWLLIFGWSFLFLVFVSECFSFCFSSCVYVLAFIACVLCWWNLRACLLADDFGQTVFLGCV